MHQTMINYLTVVTLQAALMMMSMSQVVSAQIPCGVQQTQITDGTPAQALEGITMPTLSTGY